ncbi:MAG: hypothetical protein H0X70_06915 [Segetibacter sp.]|nr:hypothetical protein [Segetibacter sp.]
MILREFFRNREKRKRIAHILAGIVILIHAYEKYEGGHNSYISFLVAGIIFLIIALFHPIIEKKAPWIDGVFFSIEAILSLIVAFDYFHVGKKALPIVYLLLGLFQFFIAFKKSRKGIQKHKLSQ